MLGAKVLLGWPTSGNHHTLCTGQPRAMGQRHCNQHHAWHIQFTTALLEGHGHTAVVFWLRTARCVCAWVAHSLHIALPQCRTSIMHIQPYAPRCTRTHRYNHGLDKRQPPYYHQWKERYGRACAWVYTPVLVGWLSCWHYTHCDGLFYSHTQAHTLFVLQTLVLPSPSQFPLRTHTQQLPNPPPTHLHTHSQPPRISQGRLQNHHRHHHPHAHPTQGTRRDHPNDRGPRRCAR